MDKKKKIIAIKYNKLKNFSTKIIAIKYIKINKKINKQKIVINRKEAIIEIILVLILIIMKMILNKINFKYKKIKKIKNIKKIKIQVIKNLIIRT